METNPDISSGKVLIPEKKPAGPITRARLRRSRLLHLALCILGLLPSILHMSSGWQAFGLGLLFPGGGFISIGGWASSLFLLSLILFVAAFIAWFGSGMIIAPIIVWGGAAIVAGLMAGKTPWPYAVYVVPGITVAYLLISAFRRRSAYQKQLKRREERNAYLPEAISELHRIAQIPPAAAERELNSDQLGGLRYLLDRALQPVGELKGFDKIDQFQTSALRYQLNQIGYGIAVAQCHYMPNFHGYLSQAQRQVIEQYLQRQIWGYWRWENAWGNLSFDPDPAKKDNIMLTGYFNINVLLYMSNTGDRCYTQPGSLTFKLNEQRYFLHNVHSINQSLLDNFHSQIFCLYPCEPNWIYPACNFRGLTALSAYDHVFGTSHVSELSENFRRHLEEEFINVDSSMVPLRSKRTGHTLPFPVPDATLAKMLSPLYPDLAERYYVMARKEQTYRENGELKIKLEGKGVDYGNYRQGHLFDLDAFLGSSLEMGDIEVAEAVLKILDETCGRTEGNGVLYYQGSNIGNASLAESRFGFCNYWRDAILKGPEEAALRGPILTDASYPAVLVARAMSDGSDLDLVLYPGLDKGRQAIRVERLRPNQRYSVEGATVESLVADVNGIAGLEIDLSGRTKVRIKPI